MENRHKTPVAVFEVDASEFKCILNNLNRLASKGLSPGKLSPENTPKVIEYKDWPDYLKDSVKQMRNKS